MDTMMSKLLLLLSLIHVFSLSASDGHEFDSVAQLAKMNAEHMRLLLELRLKAIQYKSVFEDAFTAQKRQAWHKKSREKRLSLQIDVRKLRWWDSQDNFRRTIRKLASESIPDFASHTELKIEIEVSDVYIYFIADPEVDVIVSIGAQGLSVQEKRLFTRQKLRGDGKLYSSSELYLFLKSRLQGMTSLIRLEEEKIETQLKDAHEMVLTSLKHDGLDNCQLLVPNAIVDDDKSENTTVAAATDAETKKLEVLNKELDHIKHLIEERTKIYSAAFEHAIAIKKAQHERTEDRFTVKNLEALPDRYSRLNFKQSVEKVIRAKLEQTRGPHSQYCGLTIEVGVMRFQNGFWDDHLEIDFIISISTKDDFLEQFVLNRQRFSENCELLSSDAAVTLGSNLPEIFAKTTKAAEITRRKSIEAHQAALESLSETPFLVVLSLWN